MRSNISSKSYKSLRTLSNRVEIGLLPLRRQSYGSIFQEQLYDYLNWNPIWIIIKIDKNRFDNSLRRYETLIKTYKKSMPRYQRCAWVLFRKNSSCFISQPNENQKTLKNSLRNAISYKILLWNRPHLVSYTPFNTPNVRISTIIWAKSRTCGTKLRTWRFQ